MTDKVGFQSNTNKYVDSSTLAEYFGVSPSTVRGWVRDSKIPRNSYIKAGKETYRYNLASIEAHFIEGEQNGE